MDYNAHGTTKRFPRPRQSQAGRTNISEPFGYQSQQQAPLEPGNTRRTTMDRHVSPCSNQATSIPETGSMTADGRVGDPVNSETVRASAQDPARLLLKLETTPVLRVPSSRNDSSQTAPRASPVAARRGCDCSPSCTVGNRLAAHGMASGAPDATNACRF